MFLHRARLLITTAWVGSLWTIGYIVAPTLFATLADSALAGTIVGNLFRVEAWVSFACGTALIGLALLVKGFGESGGKIALWLILGMLACTAVSYFGLQPMMAALREAARPDGVMAPDVRSHFGLLHGISAGLYLIQSLLGAALVLKAR